MKKSYIQKGAVVVIVLLLFVGFIQYRNYKNSHFPVDKKVFHVQNSLNGVMKDAFKDLPQFENAFKYGIGVDVQKDIPLVSNRRELRIEKALLLPGAIYLIYSVDLQKEDQSFKNIPVLQFKKIIFHRDNGPDFTASVDDNDFGPPMDLKDTYNYRVYQKFMKGFQFDTMSANDPQVANTFKKDYLEHVTSISLEGVTTVVGKQKIPLDKINLPVGFNFDKYLVKSIPVNKEIPLGNSILKIEKYKKYYNHDELDFKADAKTKSKILNMMADVKVEGSTKTSQWGTKESIPWTIYLNEDKLFFPIVDAKSLIITPKEYGYIDATPIKIKVTREKLKELQTHPNSEWKVADITNGSVYLSLSNDVNWKGFNLIFKYNKEQYPHIGQINWITTGQMKIMPKETTRITNNQVINIEDGKGHLLATFSPQGVKSEDGMDTYQFSGDMIDWFQFSGLNITLQSLVYVNKITAEPITIPLGK